MGGDDKEEEEEGEGGDETMSSMNIYRQWNYVDDFDINEYIVVESYESGVDEDDEAKRAKGVKGGLL